MLENIWYNYLSPNLVFFSDRVTSLAVDCDQQRRWKTVEKIFVWLVKKGQSTSLYINKLIQWPGSLELATYQKGGIHINPPLYKVELHWTLSYCTYLKAKTHWSWKKALVPQERGKWLPFQGSVWKELNLSSRTRWMWPWERCPYVSQATPNAWQPLFSFLFPFTSHAPACQQKIILFNIVSYRAVCKESWERFLHDVNRGRGEAADVRGTQKPFWPLLCYSSMEQKPWSLCVGRCGS